MRRAAAWILASSLTLAACGADPSADPSTEASLGEHAASPRAGTPASPAKATPPAPPRLPPLPAPKKSACQTAADLTDRARAALAEGRARRAIASLDTAARRCPESAARGAALRTEALSKLGVPQTPAAPAPASASLIASANAAKARGDAAEARRLFDRALVRTEQETGAKPVVIWDQGEASPVAISADGSTVALTTAKALILADGATLAFRRFLDAGTSIRGAALSRDGASAATIEDDGKVALWDVATGRVARRLVWSEERAEQAAFTSDAKRVVVASGPHFDAEVRVWRTDTGDSIEAFSMADQGGPTAIAVAGDDRAVAIGTSRGSVEIWALAPPKRLASVANKQSFIEKVRAIAFSPKSDRVAATFGGGDVVVWEAKTGRELRRFHLEGPFSGADGVAFSPDGTRLFASAESSFTGSVHVWDLAQGNEVQNKPLEGKAVALSADGRRALVERRNEVTVVDLGEASVVAKRSADVRRVETIAFGPPRTIVVGLDHEKAVRILQPAGAQWIVLEDEASHIAVGLGGELAASVHSRVTLWDLATGAVKTRFTDLQHFPDDLSIDARGVVRAAQSFQSLTVVAGDKAGAWKTEFDRKTKSMPRVSLARHAELAAVTGSQSVSVLDLVAGRLLPIADGLGRFQGAEISPDGRVLFVAVDESLGRFDPRTAAPIGAPVSKKCRFERGGVSFDGARVVTSCHDKLVVDSFGERPDAPPSQISIDRDDDLRAVVIAPHGDLLAAADDHGRVAIYSVADGARRGTIRFLPGADGALLTAPDGRVELLGKATGQVASRLVCRVGPMPLPFEACSEALEEPGLLAEVLGG